MRGPQLRSYVEGTPQARVPRPPMGVPLSYPPFRGGKGAAARRELSLPASSKAREEGGRRSARGLTRRRLGSFRRLPVCLRRKLEVFLARGQSRGKSVPRRSRRPCPRQSPRRKPTRSPRRRCPRRAPGGAPGRAPGAAPGAAPGRAGGRRERLGSRPETHQPQAEPQAYRAPGRAPGRAPACPAADEPQAVGFAMTAFDHASALKLFLPLASVPM